MENAKRLTLFSNAMDKIVKKVEGYNDPYGRRSSRRFRNYTAEDIEEIINGSNIVSQRTLSREFFERDGFYKRILLYYATILTYEGILIPIAGYGHDLKEKSLKKKYYAALDYVESLDLKNLSTRIVLRALVDGSYYGCIQTVDRTHCVLLDLPSCFCRSRYKDYSGNDIVEFDVEYFDSITDADDLIETLNNYPKFISSFYRKYKRGKTKDGWVRLPAKVGVCFSLTEDARPPFLNIIPATIQYDQAVDTEQERAISEIRKIIVQHMPHMADGGLVFEPDEATVMHDGAVQMLKTNKNLSILTTYADVDAISLRNTADSSTNILEKMLDNIYTEAGASVEVFSSRSSQTLKFSIINSISTMMILANKISGFISYLLNDLFGNNNISFVYKILPISLFNRTEYITDSFKLAQSGYSFIIPSLAMGISQRELMNLKDLEKNVLKMGEYLEPLSSAYTQSSDSGSAAASQADSAPDIDPDKRDPGRPTKSPEDKTEETVRKEESIEKSGGTDE